MNTIRLSRVFLSLFGSALLMAALLLFLLPSGAQAEPGLLPAGVTRYVSPTGDDAANECTNSSSPCRTVQHAIDVAQAGDEIRVAQGTYTDTVGTVAFITKSITLRGGWDAAFGVYSPALYPTMLDGQQLQPVILISSPITMTPITPVVDGFIVMRGYGQFAGCPSSWVGSQCGGGIASKFADPIITNNVITNNIGGNGVSSAGGGIFLVNSTAAAVISHNVIISNVANTGGSGWGGGMYLCASNASLFNNQIVSNTSGTVDAGGGGGIVAACNSNMLVQGNTIEFNIGSIVSDTYGAGINVFYSQMGLISNSIRYNRATGLNSSGGGIFVTGDGARLIATDNIIQGNLVDSKGSGGGIQIENHSTAVVTHNQISSNVGGWIAGGIFVSAQSSADVISNTILANNADEGGGIGVDNASAWISSNLILSNTTRLWGGGGLRIQETSTLTIADNLIAYNGAYTGGQAAGGMDVYNSVIALLHNSITSNTSYDDGAFVLGEGTKGIVDGNLVAFNVTSNTIDSLAVWSTAPITFTNNVIANNNAKFTIYGQNTSVVNNTIVNNNGGLIVWGNAARASLVRNNILANTYFGAMTGDGGTIAVMDYNNAWGNTLCDFCGLTGIGNISANPQFVSSPNGDYHLRFGSPAMNTGANTNAPSDDKDGVKRPQMGRVDMGAYEVVAPHTVYLPTILK